MPEKFVRRIGFMRKEERELENKRMRASTHVQKCNAFADELYQALLICTPDEADTIIAFIKKHVYQQ